MLSSPWGYGGTAMAGALSRAGLCVFAWLLPGLLALPASAQPAGPTVQEVVEFTRIVHPRDGDPVLMRQQVSPDGRSVVIVTRNADVATNRNRYQFLLLDLDPERLASGAAPTPRVLAHIVVRDDNDASHPAVQDVSWVDERSIVFRLRSEGVAFQVHRLDAVTGQLEQLTFASAGLVRFALSRGLKRIVYAAPHDNPPLGPGELSVVVGNRSFWSIIHGQNDWRAQQRLYRFFVAEAGRPGSERPLTEPVAEASFRAPTVDISPDGRWALLPRFETARQLQWMRQYPLVQQATDRFRSSLSFDPLAYFVRPSAYVPRRLVAVRLSDGREQAMLDAPDDSLAGIGQDRTDRLWMDAGRSVVLGGSHLPQPVDPARGASAEHAGAAHLVEYWPDSGEWRVIAPLDGRLEDLHHLPGRTAQFAAVDAGKQRRFQRDADGRWHELAFEAALTPESGNAGWSVRIAQGLNQPPDVVADGPAGRTVRLTRLNPQVDESWGSMGPYRWTDDQGRVWNGGLMVPAGYDPSRRHAVVIQTYGFSPDRFYLDGSNIGDGYTSGFAGRAFLRQGMLVVAMPLRSSNGWPEGEMPGAVASTESVKALIRALVEEGLADQERVGIMGFSATGERVLHTLTFSDAPLRSATLMDGDANTLFSYTITSGASDTIAARKERTNEGAPFGEGLQAWLRNDPALHTECVRAALRIETYGPWVLNNWDLYVLLRRQYKPVEMVRLPGGSHTLLIPGERMISLQGNVDWHRFWLLGERRTETLLPGETAAALDGQYKRWEQMLELKRADAAKPACARQHTGQG